MRRAALLAAILVAAARVVDAHPAPFSYLDLRIEPDGVNGSLVLHDYDVAHDLGIASPETLQLPAVAAKYRDMLTQLVDSRLAITADGRRVSIAWGGIETIPDRQSVRLAFRLETIARATLGVRARLFPYDPVHQTFVNVYEGSALRYQGILDERKPHLDYFTGTTQGSWAVVKTFVPSGVEHILIGPDHVLFLIGLLLLGGSLWRLAGIVTAFTFGHSVTLSLAALDIWSPPSSLVEPAIALSIVFVGADNLLVQREGSAAQRDIRAWVAGVFGLVHGFGFASVLKEFGLPQSALGWSLFSFNVGVEVGQLAIVLVVATALAAVRRRNVAIANRLAVAGSIVVVAAGVYWFVERVFFGGGTA